MRSKFKDEHPFGWWRMFLLMLSISTHQDPYAPDKRKAEAERIRQKYPDRIPVRVCSQLSVPRIPLTVRMLHMAGRVGHLREGRQDGHPND